MSRLFMVVVLVLVCVQLSCQAEQDKSKCNDKDADEAVAQIMTYGLENRHYPTTKAELKKYCK